MTLPDLAGRVAVVTGASRGIGAGLAREFAARGMRLGLCARGAPSLPAGPEGTGVIAQRLDVGDAAAVDEFCAAVAARFGAIDLWINNAGVLEPIAPFREITDNQFQDHFQVNVMGVIHGTRAFLRHVRGRSGEGVLINVSSGAAWKGYAGWAAYCASKAAVDRITEVVQAEEQASGLRAYAVAPGVVDTAMQERIRASSPEDFPDVERFLEMKAADSFNTIPFVARHFLAIAFDPDARPDEVCVRLPAQKG